MIGMLLHNSFVLICLCVAFNTLAQVMMKSGLNAIGNISSNNGASNILIMLLHFAQSPLIVGGVLCFVFSLSLWLMALSKLDLSVAYPMMSLGYVTTAVFGYLILGESFSLSKIIGICVIIMGVYLVSRS
jgi:multidrug transporter EmrE-like cation transporter